MWPGGQGWKPGPPYPATVVWRRGPRRTSHPTSFWSDRSSGRADYFAEASDDLLGDGARFACSEDALVEFGGGDDFGGGAGEEAFVAGIDIMAGQIAFGERDA